MKQQLPTGADVEQAIEAFGLFDAETLTNLYEFIDTELLANAALREFEELTGEIPLETDDALTSADQIRFYDPPGPNHAPQTLGGGYRLDIGGSLTSFVSLRSGITTTDALGTLLTLNTDFFLLPYNAPGITRPWTAIEFITPVWGQRRSIKLVGRFGFGAAIPEDVWLAIVHRAVSLALPQMRERVTGGALGKSRTTSMWLERIPI